MKILIKDNFDDELKKIWEELENKSSITIFQKYQWNYHWYKYICNNDAKINLKIFLIFQNEDLIAILPFYIKKNFTHRSLEWVGGLYSDYKGPIFKNSIELSKEEFSYIWKKIILAERVKRFGWHDVYSRPHSYPSPIKRNFRRFGKSN